MNCRVHRCAALVLCAALSVAGSLATAPAASAQMFAADRVYLQSRSERSRIRISLDQAVDMVRRRTGGKVISASTRSSGGRTVHRIKVLKDGKVSTHTVNAN